MKSALVALFFNIIFLVTRWDVRASQKEDATEGVSSTPTIVNMVTGSYAGDEPEEVVTEYYNSGDYAGRIKQQLALIDGQSEPIPVSRYVYHDTYTEVFDLFDRKSVFRFDENNSIKSVESYDVTGKRIPPQYYCWEDSCLKQMEPPPKEEWSTSQFLREYFGETFVVMAGYYDHPLESGVQGLGEISDRVRVTFINGILNLSHHCGETARLISYLHGGVNVHYVYRPTQGWSSDLLSSARVKFGHMTAQAYLLASKWKELIEDMGGPGNGGTIIHYAHSVGASDSWNARTLMTPEEKKMIRVVTIGSPFMIYKDGFQSVVNYASVRDGVSLLGPIGYVRGIISSKSNVKFVGTFWGIPIVDHMMDGDAYRAVLVSLGKDFVSTYGYVDESATGTAR